jgi:geranylgeranyl pyrophosphate synthase
VELVHCYSLVHDDLPSMDNDDFRRGKPAVHKAFGEGPAVLVGDALQSLAFEVLAHAPSEPGRADRKSWAMEIITTAAGVQGMIRGQWLDISLTAGGAGEEVYNDIAGRKTGALIRASVVAGAILGGAAGGTLAVMAEYGAAVGLAFQLRDDLADSGKPGAPSALDAVSLFGRDIAVKRLAATIASALEALARGGIDSEDLRALAMLLAPEGAA